MQGAARRPAEVWFCTHCEAADQPGLVEETRPTVFRCTLLQRLLLEPLPT